MAGEQLGQMEAKIPPGHALYGVIRKAYEVFAYPKPSSIEVCEGCCMEAEIEADFFNPPIEDLPLAYVRDWYFAAYDHGGIAKETWAYLLPRILEILACNEQVSSNGLEVSLNRFQTGNPDNWSVAEWCILDRFQRDFLRSKLAPGDEFLDDFICMFGIAGWSVEDLLNQVASAPDEVLAERFWNDWCRNAAAGRESIWITAFWEGEGRSLAYEFYTSEELLKRMQDLALKSAGDPGVTEKAFAVAAVIEDARSGPANASD